MNQEGTDTRKTLQEPPPPPAPKEMVPEPAGENINQGGQPNKNEKDIDDWAQETQTLIFESKADQWRQKNVKPKT